MKPINLLSRKIMKLKDKHGYVDMDMLTKSERKQLGKPVKITNIWIERGK